MKNRYQGGGDDAKRCDVLSESRSEVDEICARFDERVSNKVKWRSTAKVDFSGRFIIMAVLG